MLWYVMGCAWMSRACSTVYVYAVKGYVMGLCPVSCHVGGIRINTKQSREGGIERGSCGVRDGPEVYNLRCIGGQGGAEGILYAMGLWPVACGLWQVGDI